MSKFKHDQSEKCSFCGIQSESTAHLFVECNIIIVFLNELQQIINTRCNVTEQLAMNNPLIPPGLDPNQTQNKVIDQIIPLKLVVDKSPKNSGDTKLLAKLSGGDMALSRLSII